MNVSWGYNSLSFIHPAQERSQDLIYVQCRSSFGRAVHREYFSSTFSSQSMLIATGCNFKMGNYYQVYRKPKRIAKLHG